MAQRRLSEMKRVVDAAIQQAEEMKREFSDALPAMGQRGMSRFDVEAALPEAMKNHPLYALASFQECIAEALKYSSAVEGDSLIRDDEKIERLADLLGQFMHVHVEDRSMLRLLSKSELLKYCQAFAQCLASQKGGDAGESIRMAVRTILTEWIRHCGDAFAEGCEQYACLVPMTPFSHFTSAAILAGKFNFSLESFLGLCESADPVLLQALLVTCQVFDPLRLELIEEIQAAMGVSSGSGLAVVAQPSVGLASRGVEIEEDSDDDSAELSLEEDGDEDYDTLSEQTDSDADSDLE